MTAAEFRAARLATPPRDMKSHSRRCAPDHMSQPEFAALLGASTAAICDYEQGRRPVPGPVAKLARQAAAGRL